MMEEKRFAYLRRRHDVARAHENLTEKRFERRKSWLDTVSGFAVAATAIAAFLAILDSHSSSEKQIKALQEQVDSMITQQRPWVAASPRLTSSLAVYESALKQDIRRTMYASVDLDLKNFGPTPATNVVAVVALIPDLPGYRESNRLRDSQEHLCAEAAKYAETGMKTGGFGATVFPSQSEPTTIKRPTGTDAFPILNDGPLLYIFQGCVVYQYYGSKRGATGFRRYLGKKNSVPDALMLGGLTAPSNVPWDRVSNTRHYEIDARNILFQLANDSGDWSR